MSSIYYTLTDGKLVLEIEFSRTEGSNQMCEVTFLCVDQRVHFVHFCRK